MISGAIATCRRWSSPASRKPAMVMPPPSTSTRPKPRSPSAARMSAGAIQPSTAGRRTTSIPAARGRSQAWITTRRAPSPPSRSAASSGRRPRGSITTRAGLGPVDEPHREPRVVGERGAHADDDRVGERAAAVEVAQAVRAGDRGRRRRRASRCGRRATGRPGRRERARRAAAFRQRGIERPGGARLARPAGRRPLAPARLEGEQALPDKIRHVRALHPVHPAVSPRCHRSPHDGLSKE